MSVERSFAERLLAYGVMRWRDLAKRKMYFTKLAGYAKRGGEVLERRKMLASLPLPARLVRPLEELRREGFIRCRDLLSEDLLADLAGASAVAVERGVSSRSRSKDYFFELLTPEDLRVDSPFVRNALQQDIVTLVAHYLGQVPHLNGISLFATRRSERPNWTVSQRWHRDYDDRPMVKLFIFTTPVSHEANGPFTFIPASYCDRLRIPLYPVHKPDAYMARIAPGHPTIQCYGAALENALLIDTYRCFHLGSRITDDSTRVAYQACYTTATPFYAYRRTAPPSPDMNPLVRLVLS